ncbi:MAG: GAF domain-containing protein, partial [Chloroflexota bacterium]
MTRMSTSTPARLSSFHPLSWPMWLKYVLTIGVGLAVLSIPAFIFVRVGVFEIGEQSAQAFVTEIGVKHAAAVNNAFVQARGAVDTFVTDSDNALLLTGFLLRNVNTSSQTYLPQPSETDIADLFRNNLLNPASAAFDGIRLLDRNGQVLITASVTASSFTHTDNSQSAAYLAIQSAELQDQSRAVAITNGTLPVVEVINTISWRDGSPLGYVVATLNDSRIFFNNMRLDDSTDNYSAYSFLTTAQGVLFAPPAIRARALEANQSIGVSRALAGQSGATTYAANDNIQYVGYYTSIGGTPFSLITQAPQSVVFDNARNFFQVRVFIVGAGVFALLVLLGLILSQLTVPPLNRLRRATQALSDGNFDVDVPDAKRGDEIGLLAASFVNMRDQVRTLIDDLESRVEARTRDISATQDISRFAATQRDLQTLMDRVVDLLVERFPNIYHAQIFLIDDDGRDAVLRASTGDVGKQLLSRGHRLSIGSLSVIGQVTQQGRLIVARDAAVSQIHRRNEFLPDTRAELAIPLRVGERVIGALDVQSKTRDTFEEDQMNVLQTMADQIAVAIQNALLYEESLRRFAEIEATNRDATRHAWQEFIRDQRLDAIIKDAGFPTETDVSDLRRAAIKRAEPVIGKITNRNTIPIAIPVQ